MDPFGVPVLSDADLTSLTGSLIHQGTAPVYLLDLRLNKLRFEDVKTKNMPLITSEKHLDKDRMIEIEVSLPYWLVVELEEIAWELGISTDEVLMDQLGFMRGTRFKPSWLVALQHRITSKYRFT